MHHETFKDYAAGIQSLVVCIALIVGGIWTYYTFGFLQDTISLDLELDGEQLGSLRDGNLAPLVKLKVKNNGSRSVRLDLSNRPLIIQKVKVTESSTLLATRSYTPLYHAKLPADGKSGAALAARDSVPQVLSNQGIQPKAIKVITFWQPLDEPGTYFISFVSPVAAHQSRKMGDQGFDQKAAADRLGAEVGGRVWAASTYFEVRDPLPLPNSPLHRPPQSGRR